MKNNIIIFAIILILFGGCSIDKILFPDKSDEELIASELIHSEGGILETEDFKLIIPEGTFEQSAEVELFIVENDSPDENSVSPTYVLKGIPQSFKDSLEIRIKYQGILEGLNFMERGLETEVSTSDSTYTDISYTLIEGIENDGFLTAKFPPLLTPSISSLKSNSFDVQSKWILTVNTKGSELTSLNFTIKSSDFNFNEDPQLYNDMADYFEAAIDIFKELNFDVSKHRNTHIPIIKNKKDDLPPFRIDVHFNGDMHIEMNENPVIEDYYDQFEYSFAQLVLKKFHFIHPEWPTEGICQWTRYKHLNTELNNEIHDSFNSSLLSVDDQGVNSLMEYLVDLYGDDILSRIVNDMAPTYDSDGIEIDGGLFGIESVQKHTEPAREWLTDYYIYLMTSEKWQDRLEIKISSSPNYWSDLAVSNTLIESTTDQFTWAESYDRLSAKLFKVVLSSNLEDNSNLKFIIEGDDAEISLLKYRDSQFEFISTSEESITVSGINNLASNGYELYVLISNSKTSSQGNNKSEILLSIEQSQKPIITSLSIHLQNIDVNIKRYYSGGSTQDAEDVISNMSFYDVGEPAPAPTFEDNVFYQAYSFVDDTGIEISGKISVEFNENLDRVISFSAEHNIDRSVIDPSYKRIERSISGHDLPMANHSNFQVFGLVTCDILNNNLKYSEKSHGGAVGWEVTSIKGCRPANDDEPSILTIAISTK